MVVIRRNSSVELLKIFAIFIIVLSHSLPRYGDTTLPFVIDYNIARLGISEFFQYLFYYLGQLGNDIFVVAFSYYLAGKIIPSNDYENCIGREIFRIDSKKLLGFAIDTWLISVTWLIICLSIIQENVSIGRIIRSLFPITFNNNWFITCYILFMMALPGLNLILIKIDGSKHRLLAVVFVTIYSVLQMIYKDLFYYTPLMGFITIYICVSYIRRLETRNNKFKIYLKPFLFFSTLLFLFSILALQILGSNISLFANKMLYYCNINNPFIILLSINLFLIVKEKSFYSSFVNKIASFSLLIYLIHENILFRENIKPKVWEILYINNICPVLGTILLSLFCFLVSCFLSFIYTKYIKIYFTQYLDRF